MSGLPLISGTDLVKALVKNGFEKFVRIIE